MSNSTSSLPASFQTLKSLASLITSSVTTLERTCEGLGIAWPALDDASYMSKTGLTREDLLRMQDESIARASATIIAAAGQLMCVVRDPGMTVVQAGMGFIVSSALRTATELHVVDILRDAGPNGLHVDDIAKEVQVDPRKLARILRVLATHHIFSEVRPNTFANNRISATLEKGQTVAELIQTPSAKYDRPESGLAALICHMSDEVMKSSTNILETLLDPDFGFSDSPSKCSAMKSKELNPDLPLTSSGTTIAATSTQLKDSYNEEIEFGAPQFFDVVARRDPPATHIGFEKERLRRFGVAMEGGGKMHPLDEVLAGFDFVSLPASSIVIDVGGGIGTAAQVLTQKYDHLRIIVQDREEVCEEGLRRWKVENPKALVSGRVDFQPQSFFSPQPAYTLTPRPAVFLLKHILHDWSDTYCRAILKNLRDAAGTDGKTKLLVLDTIVPFACRFSDRDGDENEEAEARRNIPGEYQDQAPTPLLPNWGTASFLPYCADMVMLLLLNGQERTLAHMRALFRSTGWEIVRVTQAKTVGQTFALVEAEAM